eukprot:3830768-Prymnesium_polylepis.3
MEHCLHWHVQEPDLVLVEYAVNFDQHQVTRRGARKRRGPKVQPRFRLQLTAASTRAPSLDLSLRLTASAGGGGCAVV